MKFMTSIHHLPCEEFVFIQAVVPLVQLVVVQLVF